MEKNNTHYVRLLLGVAQAEQSHTAISAEFAPQIAEARDELRMMRASDVLDAILECQRAGLRLAIDVRQRVHIVGTARDERQPGAT